MAKWNTAEKNGIWKGGRSVASNGYILIRVGTDHHLADVRGYAYEHRLIAEQKMGRKLVEGEQVHHINGDKTDNRPENLEVVRDIAHHRVYHRTTGQNRRLPGDANPLVECACGCGEVFPLYDESGRPRSYVSGHNPMPSPTADLIIEALKDGEKSIGFLSELHGNDQSVKVACSKLVKRGAIVRVKRGVYGRAY